MHDEDHLSNSLSCCILPQFTTLEENHKGSQSLISSLDVNEVAQHIVISHVSSPGINEISQLPCKFLCNKENDKEHLEHLTIVDNEEKQLSPFLFKENLFQHISKEAVWNEVCFPVTNHPEELMFACLP